MFVVDDDWRVTPLGPTMTIPNNSANGEEWRPSGRLAHKLVQDLLARGLADESDVFKVGCALGSQPHSFFLKPEQSCTTTVSPDGFHPYTVPMIVSAMCMRCRYHFALRLETPTVPNMCCSFGNREFPLHHFIRDYPRPADYASCEPDAARNPCSKYLRCRGHVQFCCTNSKSSAAGFDRCSFRFVVEVSEPRLLDHFVARLTDEEAFKARYDREFEQDPDRFGKVKREMQVARYLCTYLTDVVRDPPNRRNNKINIRNIKFATSFGNDSEANELFTWLEFRKTQDQNDMEFWLMPDFDRLNPALVPSRQSFFQDLLYEAKIVAEPHQTPQGMDEKVSQGIQKQLCDALHCSDDQAGAVEVKGETSMNFGPPADYTVLGLTKRTHWKFLEFAFDRQAQCDPDNWSRYFEALKSIGAAVNQESLHMRVAMLESSRDFHTASTGNYESVSVTTDPLANEYRLKFDQAQTGRERMALRIELRDIARTRSGGEAAFAQFMDAKPMNIEEALAFLDLEVSLDALKVMEVSILHERAQNKIQLQKAGPMLMGTALKKITQIRKSDELETLANDLISGTVVMELDDPIPELDGANDNADLTLPAGLKNITNTCYLNSILQYLFTIPTVRDLVIRHELYRLPDTDEDRTNRRVATKQSGISAAEYFVAEKFVGELQLLFNNLLACKLVFTEPTQKLAISAMNTAQRLATSDAARIRSTRSSARAIAPPLPARPPKRETSAPPDPVETSSTVSSATLAETDPGPTNHIQELSALVGQAGTSRSSRRNSLTVEVGNIATPPPELEPDPNDGPTNAATDGAADEAADKPEATVIAQIDAALNNDNISGTDQEDVQEVMSNMLQHLQAVTRATGHDADTDTQTDPITDLFFLTKVSHRQKLSPTGKFEWQQSVTPEAYLIAYPEPREDRCAITLHEALHKSLELEHVNAKAASDDSWLSYGSIRKLPPILHICIQRSANINNRKNGTVITIPQVLYMDRYRESAPGSSLYQLRNYFWGLRLRIADQEVRRTVAKRLAGAKKAALDTNGNGGWPALDNNPDDDVETGSIGLFTQMVRNKMAPDSPTAAASAVKSPTFTTPRAAPVWPPPPAPAESAPSPASAAVSEAPAQPDRPPTTYRVMPEANMMAIDEVSEEEGSSTTANQQQQQQHHQHQQAIIPPAPAGPPPPPQQQQQRVLLNPRDQEPESFPVQSMIETAEHLFDDMTEEEYHLHAVICHGGAGTGAGHYWVWIRDFERGVWHKYNDRAVSSHADDDPVVLAMLNSSEDPYYLAYVRGGEDGGGDDVVGGGGGGVSYVSVPRRDL